MAKVVAYDDVPNKRVWREVTAGHEMWRTDFMLPQKVEDAPMAFLVQHTPNAVVNSHFHNVDQFQVIYSGGGALGTHQLDVGDVHFARAYTPYGPIRCGKEGLGWITLRAHRDEGARYMPENRERLAQVPNRRPWQITRKSHLSIGDRGSGVDIRAIEGLQDASGLEGFAVVMQSGAKANAPAPSRGEGQHIVVKNGGLLHAGKLKNGLAIIWVESSEEPFEMIAGPDGCEALVLNYPRAAEVPQGATMDHSGAVAGEFKDYQCVLCAFVYEEAKGIPEYGIAPGTRWADVPEQFRCPDCDAQKADFEKIDF